MTNFVSNVKRTALITTATLLVSAHSMAGMVDDATSSSTASTDINSAGKWVLVIAVSIFGFKVVKGMFAR